MNRLLLALLLLAWVAPLPALAESLELGARATVEWDDNVFADEDDEEDDVSLRFQPRATLLDDEGRLRGRLFYQPSVEWFTDLDIDTAWEHVVHAEASWQVTNATVLSFTDRFARLQSINRFNQIAIDDGGAAVNLTGFDRQRYVRNEIEIDLRHQFTARTFGVLSASHYFTDSQTGIDSESIGVSGVLRRVVGPHDRLGFGGSASRQKVERSLVSDDERTRYYSVFGVWEHDFDARTTLELAAGPSLVDSESESRIPSAFAARRFPLVGEGEDVFFTAFASCPQESGFSYFGASCEGTGPALSGVVPATVLLPLVGGVDEPDDQRTTFFANIALVRRGERWDARLSYRRRDSPSAGLGTSTISDTLSLQLGWKPAPLWNTRLAVTATRFTQASDSQRFVVEVQPGVVVVGTPSGPQVVSGAAESVAVRALDVDAENGLLTIAAQLNVSRRLTERLSVFGNLFYLDRSADSEVEGFFREYDRFRVVLGVNYAFEPFRF